jgi:hypothetical protein
LANVFAEGAVSKYSRDRVPPQARHAGMPRRKVRSEARLRDYFALGPIPLSVAGAAARAGPWCLPVLLAIRAGFDMSAGGPVEASWIAGTLGTNVRRVQRAVVSLADAGMVVRCEDGVVIPSWSKLNRLIKAGRKTGGGSDS